MAGAQLISWHPAAWEIPQACNVHLLTVQRARNQSERKKLSRSAIHRQNLAKARLSLADRRYGHFKQPCQRLYNYWAGDGSARTVWLHPQPPSYNTDMEEYSGSTQASPHKREYPHNKVQCWCSPVQRFLKIDSLFLNWWSFGSVWFDRLHHEPDSSPTKPLMLCTWIYKNVGLVMSRSAEKIKLRKANDNHWLG